MNDMKPFSELIHYLAEKKDIYARYLKIVRSNERAEGFSYFTFEYREADYNCSIDFKGFDENYLFEGVTESSYDVRTQTGTFVLAAMHKDQIEIEMPDIVKQQVDATNQLIDEVEALFERYSMEADLTYCQILGVLEICKWNILGKLPDMKDLRDD